MAHHTVIPPLDLNTNGHGPFVVQAAEDTRRRADQLAAIADALPEIVPQVMEKVLPEEYTPEIAAQIAQDVSDHLARRSLLTTPQQTLTYDDGLGAWRTAPIESNVRDIDDEHTTEENAAVPLFAAEVVVTDWKPSEPLQEDGMFRPGTAVEGRFTQLWFMRGTSTGTVSPAKAREIVAEMRDFADRLEALCDRADEIAADDYEARG